MNGGSSDGDADRLGLTVSSPSPDRTCRDCSLFCPPRGRCETAVGTPLVVCLPGSSRATPPAYAAEAAKTLPNSVNLTFPGAGHGLAGDPASKECFTKVMANFLDQPTGFDHSCVQTLKIPAFKRS
jgi:pimeloyl-ACP methyl ester carboxylesterase